MCRDLLDPIYHLGQQYWLKFNSLNHKQNRIDFNLNNKYVENNRIHKNWIF